MIMTTLTTEDIITQNLELQSIQRELVKFGVFKPSISLFKTPKFLNSFKIWDDVKKENFLKLIGGRRNYKQVKQYLENYQHLDTI